jgi:hypothetical protein
MPDLKNSIKEIRKYFSLHLTEKLLLFVKFVHSMLVMEFFAIRNGKSRLILTIPMAFFTVYRETYCTPAEEMSLLILGK